MADFSSIPLIGGLAGSLAGIFGGSPTYQSPSYSDINLATENPELYKQVMNANYAQQAAEQAYANRRKGATYQEQSDLARGLGRQQEIAANQGLLGTSAGSAQLANADATMRGAIANRALQEQQALYGNLMNANNNSFNATRNAQNDIMALKTGQAQANYQGNLQNTQAQNQFFGGMFNAGLGMYGQQQNLSALQSMYGNGGGGSNPFGGGSSFSPYGSGYYGGTYAGGGGDSILSSANPATLAMLAG